LQNFVSERPLPVVGSMVLPDREATALTMQADLKIAVSPGGPHASGHGHAPRHDPVRVAHARHAAARPRRLLLMGLPPVLAEPVEILADILGWDVTQLAPGPAMPPPADLCLAMVPVAGAAPLPPIAVWSPNKNLNEHISRTGLSILEQPPCIQHLEQLLQLCAEMP